jgi:peptide/nickel transport system substrate-binding protein
VRQFSRGILIALLAGALAGCGKASQTSENVPGVLRVAIQQDVKNLNPLLNSNTTDGFITALMFEPLLAADDRGDPVPMLATQVPTLQNGGISKDGLTITYHLRHDAKWTDGVPVTSKDVKWSWQAIMNPSNNVISRHGYDDVRSIDTPDPWTVVVHLKESFAPFVNTFFAESDQPYPVAPAHVLAKYPNINQIPFNSEPNVSDGPFKFGEWSHGDHITLVANDDFFMGKPGLRQIYLRIVPDENTSVNLLRTHAIDWIYEASIETYPAVSSIPDVTIHWNDVNGYEYIQFNDARPLLRDVRIRQAIAYALNKKQMIQEVAYGQEKEASEDIPDWMWAYDPAVKSYPYDPARARALLESAGWRPGRDGIMQKDGQPLILVDITNDANVTRRKESVILQENLRRVGIEMQIRYLPGDVIFAPAGEGGTLASGNFDITQGGWTSGVDPDDSSQYTCNNFPPNGNNDSRYCSSAMDAAERAALTHFSEATRKKAYARIQTLLHDDVPEIFVYWNRSMEPISVNFKGFDPDPAQEGWNAWQWSI